MEQQQCNVEQLRVAVKQFELRAQVRSASTCVVWLLVCFCPPQTCAHRVVLVPSEALCTS